MFKPRSERLESLSKKFAPNIDALEEIFQGNVGVYIDYANVRPWATKLGWNIDLHRLKTFLHSFDNIKVLKFFDGILSGDVKSERAGKDKLKMPKGLLAEPLSYRIIEVISNLQIQYTTKIMILSIIVNYCG